MYTLIEYQNVVEKRMLDGSTVSAKGSLSLFLSNGHSVNYIDDDTFKVVETDEIIRRVK
ncbi:hypothetical protein X768_32825 [Mesorhizobium sp. LSJC265A00]|nr:hypothetical protein X768_32825 [Mesorhizobium sp. LSJC265A00]